MMKREMRHYLGLALRELLAQKIIAALLLIAVVLSTMLTTAVGQSAGVLQCRQLRFIQLCENSRQLPLAAIAMPALCS